MFKGWCEICYRIVGVHKIWKDRVEASIESSILEQWHEDFYPLTGEDNKFVLADIQVGRS
jgi:hypothetical protein